MNDLRDQLRTYIDGIADPVTAERKLEPVRRRRPVRPVAAFALGAAAVLIPVLVLAGLGVFAGDPEPGLAPATQPTVASTVPPTTPTETTLPPTTVTTVTSTVVVPDLVGLQAAEAVFLLEGMGLRSEPSNVFGTAAEPGTIVDQFPAPGDTVAPGETIAIGVAGIALCEPGPEPTPDEGTQVVSVFFACGGGDGTTPDVSHGRYRIAPAEVDAISATIQALLAGPTEEERGNGYSSFFGPETAGGLNGVTFDGSHLVIDFNQAAVANNATTSTGMLFYHAELYANAFQFEAVEAVELHLDGDCEAWSMTFQSDGCRPMTRTQWETTYPGGG